MTRAIAARRHGDDFQARLFWLHAARLLDPYGNVVRVAYETGPKAFDDILVEYDPKAAPKDHEGRPIYRRHVSCKWHTTAGTFGFADLADPGFVNATQFSLLQRVRAAQQSEAPAGVGCRFELVTNWRINPDDPLIELVDKSSDAIRRDRLFTGKADRSRMGKVRRLWREHLGIDDDELGLVARVLAVAETSESLLWLRERLDDCFGAVGLRRIPASESAFPYDDLIIKLLAQNRIEFDRDSFREMARHEGILVGTARQAPGTTIGIRSFMHPIDNLENRCDRLLNLVPYFDGRYIRDQTDWQLRVLPELQDFVVREAQATDRLRVILDAHSSLAFATGSVLDVKSGKAIEIEQRTQGRCFWAADGESPDPGWPELVFDLQELGHEADEIAVSVSLTHDIAQDVEAFILRSVPRVGRVLRCTLDGGHSQQVVRCGGHAWSLAEAVVGKLSEIRSPGKNFALVHLFLSGPNGFAFYLGQNQKAIGPVKVYEWDFEGGGGYSPGIALGGSG